MSESVASAKTILLVDDSENDAVLLKREFTRAGLANPIIWLSSGQKALAYLKGENAYADRDCSPLPSILMLDLRMPDMTGFDVLEWIRHQPHLKNLFVVVLSGLEDTSSVRRAYSLGANSFLTKPANPLDLKHMVQFFTGYWQISEPQARESLP